MKDVVKKVTENKKMGLVVLAVFIIAIVVFLLTRGSGSENDSIEKLKVTYSDGKTIAYNNFSKKFEKTRTITVENTARKAITYEIRWFNVENTLKKQNNFLYEINCKGDNCKTLGTSQIPVADAPVLTEIKIEPNKKQVYTVSLNFKGSEKNVKFTGELKPSKVITKTQK